MKVFLFSWSILDRNNVASSASLSRLPQGLRPFDKLRAGSRRQSFAASRLAAGRRRLRILIFLLFRFLQGDVVFRLALG
jgi:hypothetical protein